MSRADKNQRNAISRRTVLKGAAAAGGLAAGSSIGGFPTIWAQNIKDVVLRHSGPPVTAIPRIAEQATKDLGFTVQMQAVENADLLNRFLSQSNTIDCADVSLVYMRYIIGRNVLQAIPLSQGQVLGQDAAALHQGRVRRRPQGAAAGHHADHDPLCHRARRPEGDAGRRRPNG